MEKLPPLTPPYTGGGHATLKHCGGFLRLFLPLSKGELEGGNLKSSIINLKFQRSVCLLQINLTQPSLNLSINQLRICRQPSRLCFQHVQHGNRSLFRFSSARSRFLRAIANFFVTSFILNSDWFTCNSICSFASCNL